MGVGDIEIRPEELNSMANQIISRKNELDNAFQSIANQMRSLESNGWDSDAGNRLRERFNSLTAYYNANYPPAMDNYVRFLNNVAESYKAGDIRFKTEVENLSNMGQR